MWEISKPIEIISFMCGLDEKVIRMLATGLEWKRVKKDWWEVRWYGSWLTTEEMNQLPESNFGDYNIVPPEEDGLPFKGSKYLSDQSATSSLDWIDITYK
tara:strand:+ start:427 stop:726 length:300 start_codon:yes stop_codon:yes gene_type:complete